MSEHGRLVIEHVGFDGSRLEVGGWAWFPQSVTALEVFSRVNGMSASVDDWHLPSDDVAAQFGPSASRARFRGSVALPSWDIAAVRAAELVAYLEDGTQRTATIIQPTNTCRPSSWRGGRPPRLGIGITTYNRRHLIGQVVEAIKTHTRLAYDLVVCDDGSSDGTAELLASLGVAYISAPNRGIAWNKNRALYYLRVVRNCDVLILLEDDTVPTTNGWELNWVLATLIYGHVNFAGGWFLNKLSGGWGHWYQPYLSRQFSGQCVSFSADALDFAGYMDTRFKTYGFEHIEHTVRLLRTGYGGMLTMPGIREPHYFLINGNVAVLPSESHGTPELISQNGAFFEEALKDKSIRAPWRDDNQMRQFLSEMTAPYFREGDLSTASRVQEATP